MKKVVFIAVFLLGMVGLNASTPSEACFYYAIKVLEEENANDQMSHDDYTRRLNDIQADCWQNNQKEEGRIKAD
ncbi:hypothetical protein [Capnocytophaga stomatis]|uniref:hypothetical protein n=1 Tax=Capnocytophaga stomatis TaxID=1848904 RepID=UPI001AD2693A|nr:hypothetical protein [Capnocytophaga stomatis]GIM50681.1 hypothetical protein CAPN003_21330 [Capnocytophaga stomatis]